MADIVERLRSVDISWSELGEVCAAAADEIERLRAAPSAPPNEVTRTAPERIWLQVSNDAYDCDQPFPPVPDADLTWCHESVEDCEVAYVRADLAAAPSAELDALQQKYADVCRKWHEAVDRMMEAAAPSAEDVCVRWLDDEDSGLWESSCGIAYGFVDDGPVENKHHFCHKCGKPLAIRPAMKGAETWMT